MVLRAIALRVLFVAGVLIGAVLSVVIFIMAFRRGARAFHAQGTACRAELTALDDIVGPALAGSARVRLSSASQAESSPEPTILGLAIKLGGDQDLPLASFESFMTVSQATRTTDITDYLANQFSSVTPWFVAGLGIVWLRAIPDPAANVPKTGSRVERLAADIAAGRARLLLEARTGPGSGAAVRARIAELRLVECLPADDREFRISMLRTGRGLVPTGLRNGIRVIDYPVSQLARRLRGG